MQKTCFSSIKFRKRHPKMYIFGNIATLGILYILCRLSKKLNAFLKSSSCRIQEADSVIVSDQTGELCLYNLERIRCEVFPGYSQYFQNKEILILETKNCRYVFDFSTREFISPSFEVKQNFDREFIKTCLIDEKYKNSQIDDQKDSEENILERAELNFKREFYGRNTNKVEVESILKIVDDLVLDPCFIWEAFGMFVWYKVGYYKFAIVSLIAFIYMFISDLLSKIRYRKKLLETSVTTQISVLRKKRFTKVNDDDIYPGDIIILEEKEMKCDVQVIFGNLLVDESFLTGESIPIPKCSGAIVYSGTEVLKSASDLDGVVDFGIGIVVETGKRTQKEVLYNSVLYKARSQTQYERQIRILYKYLGIGTVICMVVFALRLKAFAPWSKIWFEILDIAFALINPSLSSSLNMGCIYSESELKKVGVLTNCKELIKQAGCVDMVMFDKTGTLTTNEIAFHCIDDMKSTFFEASSISNDNIVRAMLTCHAVIFNEGKYTGDKIDLETFNFTHGEIEDGMARNIKLNDLHLRVLHTHQFNSFEARMSVIVNDGYCNKIYAKGSIESIRLICSDIDPSVLFRALDYSKKGFRVLAVSWKHGDPNSEKLSADEFVREDDESAMNFLCLIVFYDKAKSETPSVIEHLKNAKIQTKMCTGDSIFTGLHVAKEIGMIDEKTEVFYPTYSNDFGVHLVDEAGKTVELDYNFNKQEFIPFSHSNFAFALKGDTFESLKESNLKDFICENSVVFARFNPEMKQELVKYFSKKSSVMFVGDGGNDIGALSSASTSLSLSQGKAIASAQFSGKELEYTIDLIRIGRSALSMSSAQFRFCFYNTMLSGINMMANLACGFAPADGCSLFSDLSAYFVLTSFLMRFKPAEFIHPSKISNNLAKIGLIDFIELFYVFIVLLMGSIHCGITNLSVILKTSKNSTVTFLGSSFIIGMSFYRFCDFYPHREKRRSNRIFQAVLLGYFASWLFIVLCLYFESERMIKIMNFIPLDSNDWVATLCMLVGLSLTPVIAGFIGEIFSSN